jgi:benzoate/toluate 1,2-dioxygenase subunit beta
MHSIDLQDADSSVAGPMLEPLEELLLVRELERFVALELELLDGRDFEAWDELFTAEGIYWAPSSVDQANPIDEVSLLFDDREIRRVRFTRLRHPRVHAQVPHSRTTHVVGNFILNRIDSASNEIEFRCRFVMHDYRPGFEQRAFSGRYDYVVVRNASSFAIKRKKATIINCDAMHFPISIPF